MARKLGLLFLGLLFFGNAFAGEIMSKEAEEHYNEALKLQQADNFNAANTMYQKVLFLDPSNKKWQVLVLNNRGVMLAQQGDLDNAEMSFKKAIEIAPNYLPAKLNLGFIYESRRTELESIKYWLKVLDIDLNKVKPQGFVLGARVEAGK